ncbi:cell division protein [Pseudomonas aeruginosa VRFPA09]|nr:cell division protein [Pseudomonas aeruginosa VRFPA09]
MVDGLQEAVEEGFAAFQVPRLQLAVQQVAHTQALGLVEQRRGVAQAADAQAAVGERPVAGLAEFGDLAERRAGAGPFGVAQVEMRVEIEDTDARQALMPTQVAGEAGEAGVGDFVAAAQADPSQPQPPAAPPSPPPAEKRLDANNLPQSWSVQLASLSNRARAEELQKTLRSQGYNAYIRSFDGMNRVFVGPVIQRAEADRLRDQLSKQQKLNGFVVRFQPERG